MHTFVNSFKSIFFIVYGHYIILICRWDFFPLSSYYVAVTGLGLVFELLLIKELCFLMRFCLTGTTCSWSSTISRATMASKCAAFEFNENIFHISREQNLHAVNNHCHVVAVGFGHSYLFRGFGDRSFAWCFLSRISLTCSGTREKWKIWDEFRDW